MQTAAGTIELDPVAFFYCRQRPAGCGFRGNVQNHRAVCRAAHACIGNTHHVGHAFCQQLGRQAHVADFSHARITLRPAVFHHQNRILIDVQLRIVDPRLVHVEVLEHHRTTAMLHQFSSGGGRLEHRAQRRQIAAQHADATVSANRIVEGADHLVFAVDRRVLGVFADGLAVDGQCIRVGDQIGFAEATQYRWQTTGVVELFHQETPGRLQVDDGRHAATDAGPVVQVELDADAPGDGFQVDHGVGRTADGSVDTNGVLEGFLGEDLRQFQIFANHLHRTHAGHVRQHITACIHSRNRGVVRQRSAQRFSHARHGRRGAHGVAGARRTRHAALGCEEVIDGDGAGLDLFAELPDHGAGTDVLAFVLAVEHRPAGDDDGRHVATGRAHQQCWSGFVATGEQHYAVDRVAANRFFNVHARQVAGEHGRRAQVRFAIGEHREFHRKTTGLDHPAFDVLRDLAEVRVARGQFRPGVANADDRLAVELMVGDALILHPAAVHEAVLVGRAKPLGGAQGGFLIRHDRFSYCKTIVCELTLNLSSKSALWKSCWVISITI